MSFVRLPLSLPVLRLPLSWRRGAALLLALPGLWTLPSPDVRAQEAAPKAQSSSVLSTAVPTMRAREERKRIASRQWRTDDWLASMSGQADREAMPADPVLIEHGRLLYQEGRRPDGSELVGTRSDSQTVARGATAACVMCHRRSGLGAVEGSNVVSPITGRYLFDQDQRAIVNAHIRTRKSFNHRRDPYTLASLREALTQGQHQTGRAMDPLMPRYVLDDADVHALATYLRYLSNRWSPGVTDREVRLATVITPDVDPERRRVFLATMQRIVAQKNGNIVRGQRSMSSGAEMALQTDRRWNLAVWELKGEASTWPEQLEQFQEKSPVFALVSGLGGAQWEPVQGFCESRRIPCWFPSVMSAPTKPAGFYSLYFSRGAALEADVLAQHLARSLEGPKGETRLLQVVADEAVRANIVAPLEASLADSRIRSRVFRDTGDDAVLARELAALGPRDVVVFWLDAARLKAIQSLRPPRGPAYVSASLGQTDLQSFPDGWRDAVRVLYPYQMPEARFKGQIYFREWLRIRNLPLDNEILQSEVYFSFNYFNDTLVDMLDNVHRDYLIERGENMLSLREGAKAEDEVREYNLPRTQQVETRRATREVPAPRRYVPRAPAPGARPNVAADGSDELPATEKGEGPMSPEALQRRQTRPAENPNAPRAMAGSHHAQAADAEEVPEGISEASGAPESTNVYPRLSLGPGQRYASRGAYVARLTERTGASLRAESEWIIP